jgi:hypothetical protein
MAGNLSENEAFVHFYGPAYLPSHALPSLAWRSCKEGPLCAAAIHILQEHQEAFSPGNTSRCESFGPQMLHSKVIHNFVAGKKLHNLECSADKASWTTPLLIRRNLNTFRKLGDKGGPSKREAAAYCLWDDNNLGRGSISLHVAAPGVPQTL